MALAYAFVPALILLNPVDREVFAGARIDGAVLAFAVAASVLTGLLFGLFPAIQATRLDLNDAVREGSSKTTAG